MEFYSFYVWMSVNIVLAVLVYFFYPETKGVPLEEMDALFGGKSKTDAVMAHAHIKDDDDTTSYNNEKSV